MIDFGRIGAYEAVVRISEETLDHRAAMSPVDGSCCGKSILCSCECRMEGVFFFGFTILYFSFFYVILCVFGTGL